VNRHQNSRKHEQPSFTSNFSQAPPTFPSSVPLGSTCNIENNPGNRWKKHEEPEDDNLHFLYTRLILQLMTPLVHRWSPLTHAFHCMTTDRPATAKQIFWASKTNFTPNDLPIFGLGELLRICRLAYLEVRQWVLHINCGRGAIAIPTRLPWWQVALLSQRGRAMLHISQ